VHAHFFFHAGGHDVVEFTQGTILVYKIFRSYKQAQTLDPGRRPFQACQKHVNDVLGHVVVAA